MPRRARRLARLPAPLLAAPLLAAPLRPAPLLAALCTALLTPLLGCEDPAASPLDPPADAAPADAAAPRTDAEAPTDGAPRPDVDLAPVVLRSLIAHPEPVALDLLWVIDDSSSMCDEQAVVPAEIEAFADALLDHLPALDLVVTAISTDMDPGRGLQGRFIARPAPAIPTPGCIDLRTGLPYVPPTDACEVRAVAGRLPPIARFGPEGAIGEGCPDGDCYREQLRFTFACMTTLGVRGDDFAAGVAALDAATACDGPNGELLGHCGAETARFFRPGVPRAVIVIADEDDCSTPDGFVHDDPARCAYDARQLITVDAVADRLAARAADARLQVFPWIAPPTPHPVRWRPYVVSTDGPECDPEAHPDDDFVTWSARCCDDRGECVGPPRPTCTIARAGATDAPRYRALAAALGDPSGPAICAPDVGASLAARVAAFAHPEPAEICLDPPPECFVGDRPCQDGIERSQPQNRAVRVAGRCLDERDPTARCEGPWRHLLPDDYEVINSRTCGGFAVRARRPLPPAAELRVEYTARLPAAGPGLGPCAVPAPCDQTTPGEGRGYRVDAGWRCAVNGGGCGTGWCITQGGAPHCTIECTVPRDCAIGACQPLGLAPCQGGAPCFCGPE